MNTKTGIERVIATWAAKTTVNGKSGKQHLQPTLASALREAEFTVDEEDVNVDQLLAVRALEAFVEKCTGVPSFVGNVEFVMSQTSCRRT
jgi:hypothetical protein